ncbi:MAG: amidohydrolase [Bacteroidetes bacterium]|nr:amidohydrolase [Bacteroidota bacterium]
MLKLRNHIYMFFVFTFLCSCSHKVQVDLIVHNAVVYTVDSSFSNAQSFAVKNGNFVAVGTNDEILNRYDAKQIIDAKGKAVYPGFIDSHCHFYGYGQGLQELDLTGTRSFEEVIEKVKVYSKINKSAWIIGRGWDQNDWAVKEFPDRYALDKLFPSTPIFLERVDGHAVLANAEALRRARINSETKIKGGVIEIDMLTEAQGGEFEWVNDDAKKELKHSGYPIPTPSGILVDNAVDLVKKTIPAPTPQEIKIALLAAQKNCFAVGLTTVDDAGLEKKIIDAMDALQKSNELKMRIYAMLTDNKENMDYYLQHGIYKTERLDVRSFKFYADGALGSRGACLLQPYSDKPDQQGFLLSKPEHFDSAAFRIINSKFQMNTHCIGDSAVKLISSLYRKYLYFYCLNNSDVESAKQNYKKNRRWRVEHFQVNFPGNNDALGCYDLKGDTINPSDCNIFPSVQPTHATSDMYWAKDRLGPDRIKYAYAYNDLLKAAGMLALGTDFPVENINPMYTFYAAVARKDLKGFPAGGFQPENALSRENTLRGMTIWGAFANFEENEKGSITPGKFADFVILDTDIMKCEIDKVPTAKVLYTFVNGENVFQQ